MALGERFDPRGILAALERHYVDYVLIGGLARVVRGADEITGGVDVCPSFAAANLARLSDALTELGARGRAGGPVAITEQLLAHEPVVALPTGLGEVKVMGSPAGAPNGFVDLRRGASKEDLGHGIRPLVASTADLARLLAALGRDDDLQRLRALRRILELEADRGHITPPDATAQTPTRRRPTPSRRTTR